MLSFRRGGLPFVAALAGLSLCVGAKPAWDTPVEVYASREYFYVGGNYVSTNTGTLFENHRELMGKKIFPIREAGRVALETFPSQSYPLVFIHGQAQTGTNWLNKPDGGAGWATYFLKQGYRVYIIDQTERARSAWNPAGNTTQSTYSAEIIEQRFTAPEKFDLWPQAKLHTQWPGTGLMGDPIFDEYYASNVQFQSNTSMQETKMQATGAAILDRIGAAVLLSHSQGGLMPWVIADVRPELVKAIVSIEPTGPPFVDAIFSAEATRPYGLTDIPLTYLPAPANATTPLQTQVVPNDDASLASCIIQAEPARQLVNFKDIPVLLESGEASYHAVYDDCMFAFLKQAGVPAERLKLADVGIHGNGHLQFLEKNSDVIAGVLEAWIRKTVG